MKNAFATIIGTSVLTAGILSMSALSASAASLIGAFSGNDTGAQGTAISNLNTLLGPTWTVAGKSDDGFGTFLSGGHGSQNGIWSTGLTGAGAFAVKAGNGYLLFETNDISTINWSTVGLVVGRGNTPGLSHLSVFTGGPVRPGDPAPVPEPLTLLGSGLALGFGGMFQKKRNAKKSAK